jgi:hypothetical protein
MFLNNMEKEFKFLFIPIKLGSTVVRNRVFVAAHSTGFSEPVDYNRGIFYHQKFMRIIMQNEQRVEWA